MPKVRVSAISYLNSLPFVYCMEHSSLKEEMDISYDIPSQCADKLLSGSADVGLIPIVETLRMSEYHIISDLCIGATGPVKSVVLAGDVPLADIETIYLDYHSRTSVMLARILAADYWHITPRWVNVPGDILGEKITGPSAMVAIGDKTFNLDMPYVYDLAGEWESFTGLPFVFACWVANKRLDEAFIRKFDDAMNPVLTDIGVIAEHYRDSIPPGVDILDYWTNNISYNLDASKREGLKLFLQYAKAHSK